jgi:acetyl-CoA carboxylase carboxyltransferase component
VTHPGIERACTLREVADRARAARGAVLSRARLAAEARRGGTMSARQRVERFLDPGSFVETGLFVRHCATGLGLEERRPVSDGVVTGWGTVDGREVAVFAQDAAVFGGATGGTSARKTHAVMDLAESAGMPLVGMYDGSGARIQEGGQALAGIGGIFARNVRLSGVVPQISLILGSCAGGAAYSPALTDVVLMVPSLARLFVTGPDVVAAMTGERVTQEQLGGAELHSSRSGVAGLLADTEEDCLELARYLLSFLPSNNEAVPPVVACSDPPDRRCEELYDIVPCDPSQAYDVRDVIESVVDDGDHLEIHPHWARNIVCALARLNGHTVGLVANQPCVLGGVLDAEAAEKAARFLRTCDAFNIPLVTLVDVPGFLPGTDQEAAGILRRGAKLLHAYCEATVPRVQLVLRKAYGGAYITMDSKSVGADLALAWPTNEIAVMSGDAAANILLRGLRAEPHREKARHQRRRFVDQYNELHVHPYSAAEQGLVDDVIDPADTRAALIRGLAVLRTKRATMPHRKHGNIPL